MKGLLQAEASQNVPEAKFAVKCLKNKKWQRAEIFLALLQEGIERVKVIRKELVVASAPSQRREERDI